MNDRVRFNLVDTNFLTRWPCDICGGATEKVSVLCESESGERICERCLEANDFDNRLNEFAEYAHLVEAINTH